MSDPSTSGFADDYVPDKRLSKVYSEANDLEAHGLEDLCPAYSELAAVEERYRDESLIGKGALKEVYRIYDENLQRWVAMARLRQDRGPDFYDLFVREARLVATLSHPNIIKVHNMGVWDDGRPFFTMDLRSKSTFADLTEGSGRDDLQALLQVFGKVCDAVAYAHSRGVLHLDLKPENIQVDDFGEVLVCDWGLGKITEEAAFEQDSAEAPTHIWGDMTLMGQIKGSLGYMAPEQVMAGAAKDHCTDIFALGCMLYCILTGQPPFTGNRDEVLEKTAQSEVPLPRQRFPQARIPESLEAVVMKATAKDPAERYQSVGQLQEEIESYLTGFSTLAEDSGFVREARLFVSRNRVPVAIVVCALLVIGVTSVLFAQHIGRQQLATEVERGRADQLSSKVEALDTEYSSYVEQTLEAKQELADSLAYAARQLRNLAIFERPVETVSQARQMVNAALQQDPECIEAHAQHYAMDCVELNYKAALERPLAARSVHVYKKYILFASAFPEFDFTNNKRPTLEQLSKFFRRIRTIDSRLGVHLERVLAYDVASRTNLTGYDSVLEAYLQYRNGGPERFKLLFDAEASKLSLWADRPIRLSGQYGDSLLRFLPFRSLEIDSSSRFQLEDLNGLLIESLNLSKCRKVTLNQPLSLPQLKRVVLRSGQLTEAQLRRMIQSNEPFTVIFQK